jgi:hypothetical protein
MAIREMGDRLRIHKFLRADSESVPAYTRFLSRRLHARVSAPPD